MEPAFALSLLIKCRQHNIPCNLELSKPVRMEKLPKEILECAGRWSKRRLWRKCYKLKDLRL